ncbi:sensor histidine kinase [Clostridium fallax]|uniref:histidine kinase n=1 Tax=Clostridium fallax TaxID=1533 RepID=A0A1M4SR21_9CLOT|nr:PAS domain S-box protein [Clostridium fallax]SHE34648.1 PAS/PAC sensor signal transduction histidine kinase [Clostridium fallax]SQB07935.1 PAS domain-containing protein [Clostridium fallax]
MCNKTLEESNEQLWKTLLIYFFIGISAIFLSSYLKKCYLNDGSMSFRVLEEGVEWFFVVLAAIAVFYFYLGVKDYILFIISMLSAMFVGWKTFECVYLMERITNNQFIVYRFLNHNINLTKTITVFIMIFITYKSKSKYYNLSRKKLIFYSLMYFFFGVFIGIIDALFINHKIDHNSYMFFINLIVLILQLIVLILILKKYFGKYKSFFKYILGTCFFCVYKQVFIIIDVLTRQEYFAAISLLTILMFIMPVIGIFSEFLAKLRLANDKVNEVKKLQKKLREITDNMEDTVLSIDKELKINYVTTSYCNIFGGTKEEHIGQSPFDVIHLEYREKIKEKVQKALENGTNFSTEYKAINKNGCSIWVESLVSIIFEDDKVVGAVINRRDVTKRIKAEEELKVSEKKYRNFFNMCSDFTYIIRLKPRKLIDANPAMIDAFKMNIDQLKKYTIYNFLDEEGKKLHKDITKKLLRGEKVTAKFQITNYLGEHIDLEAHYVPIYDEDKKLNMALCLAKNLNINKQIKELSLKNEKKEQELLDAKAYDKLKTEFFANISHELKTPVNVVFSAIQLMELKNDFKDEKSSYYLNVIKSNCYRLVRLINNIIDLTKIEAGFLNKSYSYENVVSIIENLTLSVVPYAENKGLILTFDTNEEEYYMYVDRNSMERIILNLLSNSIKFTPRGGEILVDLIVNNKGIYIKIKDTGIGISKENQKIIFERFRQVDKSFTRNHEGSGIGLSLVKSLIEFYGGSIRVQSELNKGSEFTIYMPNIKPEKIDKIDETETKKTSEEKIFIELSDIY